MIATGLIVFREVLETTPCRAARKSPGTRKAASSVTGAVVLCALSLAAARPARAEFKVYSPVVVGGELEIEARGISSHDAGRSKDSNQKQIYELGYAFTDRWATAVFAESTKESGASLRDEAVAWENVYQVFEQGEKWLDFGLYCELEFATHAGEADKFEGKLLFERPLAHFVHTLNLIGEQQFGPGAENSPEPGYAWRSAWRWRPELEPSLEAFGEFGPVGDLKAGSEQEHKLGPVLRGLIRLGTDLNMKLRYEAGYLFGLTGATPDGEFKWLLELEVPL